MKKLILLTILVLTSSSCFSQIDTSKIKSSDTTKVVLTPEVAKQVVKDLIRYDGCKVELKLTQDKVIKLEEREIKKDIIISLLKDKDNNNQFIINQKDQQINLYDDMSKRLEKELKSQKRTTLLYKIGTIAGIILTSTLLITK
jgi:phosphotransferase system IIB component